MRVQGLVRGPDDVQERGSMLWKGSQQNLEISSEN